MGFEGREWCPKKGTTIEPLSRSTITLSSNKDRINVVPSFMEYFNFVTRNIKLSDVDKELKIIN